MSHENTAHSAMEKIAIDQCEDFAMLLSLLDGAPEGGGTVLDNSLIFFASEVQTGETHDPSRMQVILAGKAGGQLRGGRTLDAAGKPYTSALCAVLNLTGVPTTNFGHDKSAPTPGL